ncbi:MAG: hypothetical protein AAF004_00970 [Pseudomonadota bacterium]
MMRLRNRIAAFVSLALAVFSVSSLNASTTLQMNLAQMVTNSDRVFVGTVVQITESTKQVGGGQIPAVTYRLKVGDAFKGTYDEIKGEKYADVTMIGSLKILASGHHPITDFPMMSVGNEYLLMVAPDGPVGLTTTMGLGQGCFSISDGVSDKVALNGANNVGLFSNMNLGFADGVAVSYSELSSLISDLVGGAQ